MASMLESQRKLIPRVSMHHAQNLKRGIARDNELYATKHAEHLARQRAAAAAAGGTGEPAQASAVRS